MTEPGDEIAADTSGGYRLPVSSIDREQVIRTLRVALAQGRLTEDEHDARAAQASASRSRAELAALTADLPAGLPAQPPTASYVRTGVCLTIAAAIVVAAFLCGSLITGWRSWRLSSPPSPCSWPRSSLWA